LLTVDSESDFEDVEYESINQMKKPSHASAESFIHNVEDANEKAHDKLRRQM
jgi:hypothetical protein